MLRCAVLVRRPPDHPSVAAAPQVTGWPAVVSDAGTSDWAAVSGVVELKVDSYPGDAKAGQPICASGDLAATTACVATLGVPVSGYNTAKAFACLRLVTAGSGQSDGLLWFGMPGVETAGGGMAGGDVGGLCGCLGGLCVRRRGAREVLGAGLCCTLPWGDGRPTRQWLGMRHKPAASHQDHLYRTAA